MLLEKDFLKTPKISIIITYYNLKDYILSCLESIYSQIYQNYEIIIVNDKSDEINSQFLNNIHNDKVKIINLKENKGQLIAFLEGLKVSIGEFVCMVDADDVLLPNYLSNLLYTHLHYNCAFVCSSSGEINQNNEIISLNSNKNQIKTDFTNYKKEDLENILNVDNEIKVEKVKGAFAQWSWNPSTSAMMRKTSLNILKYFPNKEYWKTGADAVIFSLLHLVGGSANISSICFLYRHHNSNNSQSKATSGQKRYINENYVKKLINWNIKLRLATLKMFIKNKKELIKEYNKLNYYKMFFRIIFCLNIKICAKIIKTFAHKILF